jgi:hypothetical protein
MAWIRSIRNGAAQLSVLSAGTRNPCHAAGPKILVQNREGHINLVEAKCKTKSIVDIDCMR